MRKRRIEMKKRRFMRNLICWLKYRKWRKERNEQAHRAASLAVQLVMSGSLDPPKFTGTGSIARTELTVSSHKVFIRREGWA
jgi:hypothetical protein